SQNLSYHGLPRSRGRFPRPNTRESVAESFRANSCAHRPKEWPRRQRHPDRSGRPSCPLFNAFFMPLKSPREAPVNLLNLLDIRYNQQANNRSRTICAVENSCGRRPLKRATKENRGVASGCGRLQQRLRQQPKDRTKICSASRLADAKAKRPLMGLLLTSPKFLVYPSG
ncbi:MAG: hypothetical protein H6R07_3353, partial [Proteobacteria bacterium]|nr:hypothetical protein [Pseudomonadota bacterium]